MIPENKPQPKRTELLNKVAEYMYERRNNPMHSIIPNGYYTSSNFNPDTGERDEQSSILKTTQLSTDEIMDIMTMFKSRGYFACKYYSKRGTPSYYVATSKPSYEGTIIL